MPKHLKTRVINGLKSVGAFFVQLPPTATPHKRGVHYFRLDIGGINALWGAMNSEKEGRKYRKHIVVRPSRYRNGLFELYTYHFPKQWSAACVANRNLIKEAQRRAHALEHDHSIEALEWKLRFFHHYYTVCKGGAKPEPGLKPYTRFYQYTYVCIYRQLQAEAQRAQNQESQEPTINIEITTEYLNHLAEASLASDLSFIPILPGRANAFRFRPRICPNPRQLLLPL